MFKVCTHDGSRRLRTQGQIFIPAIEKCVHLFLDYIRGFTNASFEKFCLLEDGNPYFPETEISKDFARYLSRSVAIFPLPREGYP